MLIIPFYYSNNHIVNFIKYSDILDNYVNTSLYWRGEMQILLG